MLEEMFMFEEDKILKLLYNLCYDTSNNNVILLTFWTSIELVSLLVNCFENENCLQI